MALIISLRLDIQNGEELADSDKLSTQRVFLWRPNSSLHNRFLNPEMGSAFAIHD
jgi:hypothetical protein